MTPTPLTANMPPSETKWINIPANERGSNPNRKPTIAIDFDGVIHDYREGWKDGSIYGRAVEGAAEALELLREKFYVVIFSARAYSGNSHWGEHLEGQAPQIEAWFKSKGIPFDEVWTRNGKPSAVCYIDDRAICFTGDWAQTLRNVENFRSWIDESNTDLHSEIRELKAKAAKLEMELIKAIPTRGAEIAHAILHPEDARVILKVKSPAKGLKGLMDRIRGRREKLLSKSI